MSTIEPTQSTGIKAPGITQETARHVLWIFGHEGGYAPGNFTLKLIELLAYAPPIQMAKLAIVFPEEDRAVRLAKYDEEGIAKLKAIAAGGKS